MMSKLRYLLQPSYRKHYDMQDLIIAVRVLRIEVGSMRIELGKRRIEELKAKRT